MMPPASNSRIPPAIHWIRALLAFIACQAAFCSVAQASRFGITMEALDPITQHHLCVALAMLNSNVLDIRALETLLAGEMEVASTVGMNVSHASTDPVRNEALRWIQTLQPADTLVVALEQGSNTTVYWALRQIIWRNGNGRFDAPTLARLQPGVRAALTSPQTATRVQAVETMIHWKNGPPSSTACYATNPTKSPPRPSSVSPASREPETLPPMRMPMPISSCANG